jgi:hypothetical protein
MPRPGNYALAAKVRTADRDLESNGVTVTVRAGADAASGGRETLLDEWGSALYFQKRPPVPELTRAWPHLSVFATFASTIGHIESSGGSSATGVPTGCSDDLPGLQRAANELPDAYFAAVALRYLSQCVGRADSRFQIGSRNYYERHPVLGRHPAIAAMLRRSSAGK